MTVLQSTLPATPITCDSEPSHLLRPSHLPRPAPCAKYDTFIVYPPDSVFIAELFLEKNFCCVFLCVCIDFSHSVVGSHPEYGCKTMHYMVDINPSPHHPCEACAMCLLLCIRFIFSYNTLSSPVEGICLLGYAHRFVYVCVYMQAFICANVCLFVCVR